MLLGMLLGGCNGLFLAKKWPENQIFLRYPHITHLFWSQTDLTLWDHNIPISWGNSGYLWFSGRCPFGCSAGRCMGPIAENYHFWVWYCMELNCILWYCIISYGIELYLMVLLWYCLVLHGIAWYCKMLHCIVRYRIKFYGIAWYCMVLHCTIVGFGARAVSRKTPIYFIQYMGSPAFSLSPNVYIALYHILQ